MHIFMLWNNKIKDVAIARWFNYLVLTYLSGFNPWLVPPCMCKEKKKKKKEITTPWGNLWQQWGKGLFRGKAVGEAFRILSHERSPFHLNRGYTKLFLLFFRWNDFEIKRCQTSNFHLLDKNRVILTDKLLSNMP